MRSSMVRLLRSTALIGPLSLTLSITAVVAQTMQDLGTLGGSSSGAYAVSADGSVIVGFSSTAGKASHGFKYTGSTMTDLGTLGGSTSTAYSVSADGSVIVGYSQLTGGVEFRGFKYTGSTMTDLGTLGGANSVAYGVSADGNVIVGYSFRNDDEAHAFKYAGSSMIDLGTLGGSNSQAFSVSADGSVIVGSSEITGNTSAHAFKYAGSAMTDLGTLGGKRSVAYGVSADGSVIVGSSDITGNTGFHAFKYAGSTMTDLGTLGGSYSVAHAVSADGRVIVGLSEITGGASFHAFKYAGSTMTDLGTLGGSFSGAFGVSADGAVIVGSSTITGDTQEHAFAWRSGKMIDLPETYADLNRSANNIRNTIALRTSSMALMMEYDCGVFSAYNMCISFGGRYSELSSSSNEGAGTLTMAYRITPSLRVGAFIDQRVTQAKPAGVNYDNDTPSVGAFIGYDHNGDGTGLQAKATAIYNTGKVNVTRLASGGNTEAGNGRSDLTSYAIGAELGWGFRVHEGWVATPYAGIRHTNSELGGYAEQLTDLVKFPITYADNGQRLTTMTGGLRLDGRLTEHVSIALSAGIEQDISSKMDEYAGVSDIPGLTSFSFSTSARSNRTRAVGSAALSYHIDRNQRVSAGVYVRENAYAAQATKTVMMKYEVAF